jgi:hypothetical protein
MQWEAEPECGQGPATSERHAVKQVQADGSH